jgi:type II secretory pathway component PulM
MQSRQGGNGAHRRLADFMSRLFQTLYKDFRTMGFQRLFNQAQSAARNFAERKQPEHGQVPLLQRLKDRDLAAKIALFGGGTVTGIALLIVVAFAGAPEQSSQSETATAKAVEVQSTAEEVAAANEAKAEAEQEAAAQQAQIDEQLATYGITLANFDKACSEEIKAVSGSSEFGVFNASPTLEYPELGSLVLQRTVYGKNLYGARIEQQYKCWSTSDGAVSVEMIGVGAAG